MGVKVRKYKGSWYVFINHQGHRKAKKIGSRIAAEKVRREIEARLALGQLGVERNDTSPTFASYSARWLNEHARLKCKPSTAGFYEQYLRLYVLPSFGVLRLNEISRQKAKDLVESLCKRGLAKNTVRLALTAGRSVLDAAMEDGLILANPAVRLGRFVKSQKPDHEATALTAQEARQLLRTAKEWRPQHYPMLLTAVRAGLRRGELVALRWGIFSSEKMLWIRTATFWYNAISISDGPGHFPRRKVKKHAGSI
ncbi:MAG TPA: hypothetical protein VGX94_09630 [Terriglobia bacterium]|nr:hypothetical protein [Terriglobia bacterium]